MIWISVALTEKFRDLKINLMVEGNRLSGQNMSSSKMIFAN